MYVCIQAQALLQAILASWPQQQLEKVDKMRELVDGLLPYTQRHLQRLEDCLQRSYILDFTLHAMQTALGGDDGAEVRAYESRVYQAFSCYLAALYVELH
jgi:hypothetical protein